MGSLHMKKFTNLTKVFHALTQMFLCWLLTFSLLAYLVVC